MKNKNCKKDKKQLRQIIILKGEYAMAKFSRKQAAEAIRKLEKNRNLIK